MWEIGGLFAGAGGFCLALARAYAIVLRARDQHYVTRALLPKPPGDEPPALNPAA